MSESLRIVYQPGDELTLKSLGNYLKEHGIDYAMLTGEEDMDHAMVDMPFGYLRADKFARVIQSNGYLERTYGIESEKLYGAGWQAFIHPKDRNRLLLQLAKEFFVIKTTVAVSRIIIKEDFEITVMIIINSLMNEEEGRTGFRVLIIDVSQAVEMGISESPELSLDPLTKLPDRLTFFANLEEILSIKNKCPVTLILIDLRSLDKINQLSGYIAGDNVLRDFANALKEAVDKKYFIGRIESTKFGVIVESFKKIEEIHRLVHQIQENCTISVTAVHGKFTLGLAIGVTHSSDHVYEIDVMLRQANEALRLASINNESNIVYYDEKKHKNFKRVAMIEADMFNAISQNQFELLYEPQIDTVSEKLVGMEALLRWNHPELGPIKPDEFIGIAEESGFILQIGKWVNNHALEQFESWLNQFYDKMQHVRLSINLSPLQLMDDNLIEDLSACLVKYHIPPGQIVFELTEQAIMTHTETSVHVLNQLRHLGVRLAIDDFGSGYSSLNYLRSLPINQIKIDRSFVSAFQTNMQDAAVIKATLLLADALGMEVVAEGVENIAQLKFLRDNGCQVIQGHYFSVPLDADTMSTYILHHA